jgi:hypothetical protein
MVLLKNMSEQNKHSTLSSIESAAMAGFPLMSVATAVEALNSYNYIDADWIEHIPAGDHLSSMTGAYALGAIGGTVTERFAARLEANGRERSAERVRRVGRTLTVMGSIACQLAIETSTKGTGDKWDVVSGAIATVPGLIAGRGYAKTWKARKQARQELTY